MIGVEDELCKWVVIPSTIHGKAVTAINDRAFSGCVNLKTITIPKSIDSIGVSAFENCKSLKSIVIPDGVQRIYDGAFESMIALEEIKVSEQNQYYYAEGNCLIEKASNRMIAGCKNSVIPDGVKIIGSESFNNCTTLKSLVIPSSVENIEKGAFIDVAGSESIKVDKDNQYYYSGTQEQWETFEVDAGAATVHYNSI